MTHMSSTNLERHINTSSIKHMTTFSINMIHSPISYCWRSDSKLVFPRSFFKTRGCEEVLNHQISYNLICPLHLQFLLDIFRNLYPNKSPQGKFILHHLHVCGKQWSGEHPEMHLMTEKTERGFLGKASWESPTDACIQNDCSVFKADRQQEAVYSL
jgi:hypothetical protein